MRKIFCVITILGLVLSACAVPTTTPAPATTTLAPAATLTLPAPATAAPSATTIASAIIAPATMTPTRAAPSATFTGTPTSRTASIKEIVNQVDARLASNNNFATASLGQVLNVGGQTRTGDNSNARLDFSEGTIVRLGSKTVVTVEDISTPSGNPFTRFQFEAGKLWISLFGGSMDIKTPVGVATVRGSFMTVEYDPATGLLTVDCLEGTCGFEGIGLTNLQRLTRNQSGQITRTVLSIDDVANFCKNNLLPCPVLLKALNISNLPSDSEKGKDSKDPQAPPPPPPPKNCSPARGC